MINQNESQNWATRDFTLPLLLSGVFSTVVCIALCAVMYISRDFLNNDLAPRLGLIEPTPTLMPTPTPISCPAIPAGWESVMNDNFFTNKYDWSVGKKTDTYADKNLQIVDGLLRLDIKAKQGVFWHYYPDNPAITDFYLTSQVRKVDGPMDVEYGLTFRKNGNQMLFFTIQDSGIIKVHVRDTEENWLPLLFKGYSENINVGENNELVVLGQGNHYIFCVNQYVVGETDSFDYKYGNSGIGVELENANDEATFEFDDFIIYAPAK
jgi:hypothetical protein